jgi:hypothetical protein
MYIPEERFQKRADKHVSINCKGKKTNTYVRQVEVRKWRKVGIR